MRFLFLIALISCSPKVLDSITIDRTEESSMNEANHAYSELQDTVVVKSAFLLWSDGTSLNWDDFMGAVNDGSKYKAMTYVKLKTKSQVYEDSLVSTVGMYFNREKSWSKLKVDSSDLLKHEQLHFDIGEVIARKLRRDWSKYEIKDLNLASLELKRLKKKYFGEELDQLNFVYDEETEHGLIKDKQKEWEDKIAKELEELEAYSSTKVVVKRVKKE